VALRTLVDSILDSSGHRPRLLRFWFFCFTRSMGGGEPRRRGRW
jgi:hypothetical protein